MEETNIIFFSNAEKHSVNRESTYLKQKKINHDLWISRDNLEIIYNCIRHPG